MKSYSHEESDQAGIIYPLFAAHIQIHKDNKPDPNCAFCKNFILNPEGLTGSPLESYKFIILDISDDK